MPQNFLRFVYGGRHGHKKMREATVTRETKETNITATVALDGFGSAFGSESQNEISTGVGFLDHMLNAFAVHGGFGLKIHCAGDLEVDCHHTAEDVGIVLGNAVKSALGDLKKVKRFGSARIPMDESLGWCDIDISGRPFLVFDAKFKGEKVGSFDTQMVEEFMRAFAFNAGITLHIGVDYGENDHHKIESMFKALAYALKKAVRINNGDKVISSKGVI